MNKPVPAKGRILIGEDVRVIGLKMSQALQKAGYEVEIATDGEECLRKARAAVPDLMILDIMMPKMHGIDVLKALRAEPRTREVDVIVCSAKDFDTERDEATELGALDYLIKPIAPAVLVEKVKAVFDGRTGAAPAATAAPSDAGVYRRSLDTSRTHFTLWGARGSTPTVGGRFQRHGGNTSCLSVTAGDQVFIFDAGSGIRDLGLELMAGPRREVHLFITHPHWDHIQGFPFFTPAFVPGFEITVYGSRGFGKDLESLFRGQLDHDYFPVQIEDLKSHLQFRHLPETAIELGDARVTWEFAQHPGATVGYKIELPHGKIAWVPDNEFLQGYTGPPTLTRDDPRVGPYEKMIAFLADAALVIHEAQYTPEEYPAKIGWGHSSVANAALLMKFAAARRWLITHHDPMHDDVFLETKLNLTRQVLEEIGHPIDVVHGYDGKTEYL